MLISLRSISHGAPEILCEFLDLYIYFMILLYYEQDHNIKCDSYIPGIIIW
jgi:hypothetical protein